MRGANGRRVSRGRFRVVGCGAFRLDFDGGLGGEAEETALFLPVMRQVLGVGQLPNFNRFLKEHNVDFELHTAGQYKRTLTLFGENTDAARDKFQEELEDTHKLFKSFVTENRPLPPYPGANGDLNSKTKPGATL